MKTTLKYQPSSFSILIVFVLMIIVGACLLPLMNVQLNPSRSLPRLSVSYSWPDASARVIEQEVTSKLEGLFSAVRGIKDVSSVSSKGYGRIDLSFKKSVNLDAVRFEIASLIRQSYSELPQQVSFPEISLGAGGQKTSPILSYTLNGSSSPYFIQKYAEDHLVPALSLISGINEVKVYGSTPYEWQIEYSSDKIQNLGIRADEITQSINTYFRSDYLGNGTIGNQSENNRITGFYLSAQSHDSLHWEAIPVKKVDGRIVHLGDIAKVSFREQQPNSYFRINGLNTINMVIYPEADVNTLRLAQQVKEEVEQLRAKLPPGYSLLLANDTTQFIRDELHKIAQRTILSLLILLTFVLLISRQLRYLMLIFFSIVANLSIACIFYYILKIEIHLYSLAGITISFGIIIDNSIIMIDHLRHQGNKKAFLAILAATLTTIGALSIVFFLKEEQRINLVEFAQVIIINLSVSMAVALFFIPALMDKIRLRPKKNHRFIRRKRRALRISRIYERIIRFSKRFKWAFIVLFILGFGIPVHWLPAKIEKEGSWAKRYNETIGSPWFQEEAKPILEKALGGSLRLFTEHVFESSFYSEPTRTKLHVSGKMPEGCTVQQLNEAIKKMENFISQYDEVELFETSIYGYRNSNITIQFKPEHEFSSFPYYLKEEITSKAISLGAVDWGVYGVGRGFSNELHSGYKNSRIILEGYNYDQLYRFAEELKERLSENERAQGIEISGSAGWNTQTLHEYFLEFDHQGMGLTQVSIGQFYGFLKDKVYQTNLPPVFIGDEMYPATLIADTYGKFNVWDLNNQPVLIGDKQFKLSDLGQVEKRKTGNDIHKNNQQYQLVVAYDFVGPGPLAKMVQEEHEKETASLLPLGYTVKSHQWQGWDRKDKKQYYLLLFVSLIIYFICAILLESLLQPLAIIAMIPLSFIGVFLTFYLFDFNFDQGGFASFILLSGIVVNAGLYIINDYNNFCRKQGVKRSPKLYMKAFNHKIIPIFLTIISTILGLVPFAWEGQNEVFWFAFAVGAMGGLLFSIIALLIYLPMFIYREPKSQPS